MSFETVSPVGVRSTGGPIRIGFVPLCDCAPVVMAQELGLFASYGLQVELKREVGWATIRDKLVMRDLEAAHAPAAMVLAISLGIGSYKVPCVTGLVLNLHGNAITLSNQLWESGVRDAATLRDYIRSRPSGALLTFGVAFSCSSHRFLLEQWLRRGGLNPARDINVVVVPPPQMAPNLKAHNLDGYCVGEPWNSVAVLQGAGWIAATSPTIAPGHPEKVLLVRADFAETRAPEHRNLIAALREACDFCQRAENRQQVIRTLAGTKYLNTSAEAIGRSLAGPFEFTKTRAEPFHEPEGTAKARRREELADDENKEYRRVHGPNARWKNVKAPHEPEQTGPPLPYPSPPEEERGTTRRVSEVQNVSEVQGFKARMSSANSLPDLHVFAGTDVNEPGPDKAAWVRDSLVQSGVLPKSNGLDQNRLATMFRVDLFNSAVASSPAVSLQ